MSTAGISDRSDRRCPPEYAYPDWVEDGVAERVDAIIARRIPALLSCRAIRAAGERVRLLHGDTCSLSGWRFPAETLARNSDEALVAAIRRVKARIIACSHTWLPVARYIALDHGDGPLINNGAAGMPNLRGQLHGVIAGIAATGDAMPAHGLYGLRLGAVLFQAGASQRGREFAANHAECVFISSLTPATAAEASADLRARAVRQGRRADDLLIFNGLCVITGDSDDEAWAPFEDYRAHVDLDRTLTLFSGYTGVDFLAWDLDVHLEHFESNAIQTFVEIFTKLDPERTWTLREVGQFLGVGGFAPIEAGSPRTIVTRLKHWMEVADLDGFNLMYVVSPGDVRRFVDLVVPELQRRGMYKTVYATGTFREKLYGAGRCHLDVNHPGARFRSQSQRPPKLIIP